MVIVKAEQQFIDKEFWLIFDHLPQGKELVFTPWSPEQGELVVELAERRRASLLSWEPALFLSLHQTAAWDTVWRQHSALCFGKREEGIWKVWEESALLFFSQKIQALLFLLFANGKKYNWQSMDQTSAAIIVVSGYKSKAYKRPETGVFGHQTPWHSWAAVCFQTSQGVWPPPGVVASTACVLLGHGAVRNWPDNSMGQFRELQLEWPKLVLSTLDSSWQRWWPPAAALGRLAKGLGWGWTQDLRAKERNRDVQRQMHIWT